MQKKKIIQIYREGWWVIMRVFVFAIAFWVVLLPLKILEVFGESLPEWVAFIIAILIFAVYLPFAAYFVYHLVIDLNKTDHKFVPLLERLRKKSDQNDG